MSVALQRPMTLDEFLAWEEKQEPRWEFDGFAPMAMTGGTAAHSAIQLNLYLAVGARLRGRPCRMFTADLKVQVAGSIRYPDGFVVCSPVPGPTLVITEPVVVFEVLSPSTASIDIGAKTEIYAIIRQLADEGLGILLISSELPEILGLSDRILVMRRGRIVGEFDGEGATEEVIMRAAVAKEQPL